MLFWKCASSMDYFHKLDKLGVYKSRTHRHLNHLSYKNYFEWEWICKLFLRNHSYCNSCCWRNQTSSGVPAFIWYWDRCSGYASNWHTIAFVLNSWLHHSGKYVLYGRSSMGKMHNSIFWSCSKLSCYSNSCFIRSRCWNFKQWNWLFNESCQIEVHWY